MGDRDFEEFVNSTQDQPLAEERLMLDILNGKSHFLTEIIKGKAISSANSVEKMESLLDQYDFLLGRVVDIMDSPDIEDPLCPDPELPMDGPDLPDLPVDLGDR